MKSSYLSIFLTLSLALLAGCASTQPYQTKKSITSIAFSPDRVLLAVANANEIQLIDVDSRRHVRTLRVVPQDSEEADQQLFRHGVGDNMVFLDNDRIASTGMGGLFSIWDVRSGNRLSVIDPLPGEEFASTIDYSPATNHLLIGTSAGQILLTTLNGNNAEPLVPVTKLESYVWDLQFSRDGRYFASASLVLTRPREPESTDEPADAFANVNNDEEPDRSNDESGGEPADVFAQTHNRERPGLSNVIIWDMESLEMIDFLNGASGVFGMRLVPGERALLTAGDKVQVWAFLTREQSEEINDPSMVAQSIGYGTILMVSVAGLAAGVVPPMDFFAQTFLNAGVPFIPTAAFVQHACARAAAISPDGRTIVSTTWGPTHNVMAVIDRKENKVIEKWTAESAVCGMQFSLDGKHLVAATSRGAFIFDTTSWKKTKLKELIRTGND
jgi:WD40 repeat protein